MLTHRVDANLEAVESRLEVKIIRKMPSKPVNLGEHQYLNLADVLFGKFEHLLENRSVVGFGGLAPLDEDAKQVVALRLGILTHLPLLGDKRVAFGDLFRV